MSFKLPNFLGFSQVCAESSPYAIAFLDLLWFHALNQSDSFPMPDSTSSCHHSGSYCTCPKVLVLHLVSTVHAPTKEFPPQFYFSPDNPGHQAVVSRQIGMLIFPDCSGEWRDVNHPFGKTMQLPLRIL